MVDKKEAQPVRAAHSHYHKPIPPNAAQAARLRSKNDEVWRKQIEQYPTHCIDSDAQPVKDDHATTTAA